MNKVIITGNISRDPESRTTQSGISLCNFNVAVQRRVPNAQGVREADFLPVVAWRQTADYVTRYLHKGSKVLVEGSIQTRSYDAQDGSKRYVTEIVADHVEGLDRRENGAQTATRPAQPAAQEQGANDFTEVADDRLPF